MAETGEARMRSALEQIDKAADLWLRYADEEDTSSRLYRYMRTFRRMARDGLAVTPRSEG